MSSSTWVCQEEKVLTEKELGERQDSSSKSRSICQLQPKGVERYFVGCSVKKKKPVAVTMLLEQHGTYHLRGKHHWTYSGGPYEQGLP